MPILGNDKSLLSSITHQQLQTNWGFVFALTFSYAGFPLILPNTVISRYRSDLLVKSCLSRHFYIAAADSLRAFNHSLVVLIESFILRLCLNDEFALGINLPQTVRATKRHIPSPALSSIYDGSCNTAATKSVVCANIASVASPPSGGEPREGI